MAYMIYHVYSISFLLIFDLVIQSPRGIIARPFEMTVRGAHRGADGGSKWQLFKDYTVQSVISFLAIWGVKGGWRWAGMLKALSGYAPLAISSLFSNHLFSSVFFFSFFFFHCLFFFFFHCFCLFVFCFLFIYFFCFFEWRFSVADFIP